MCERIFSRSRESRESASDEREMKWDNLKEWPPVTLTNVGDLRGTERGGFPLRGSSIFGYNSAVGNFVYIRMHRRAAAEK